jgi:hypothetical protein
MKSFLLKNNTPTIKWSLLPENIFFEGKIPEGYDLAVAPSGNDIILDVDVKNGKNGFNHIPYLIRTELDYTFYYNTRSGGRHYWLNYSGDKVLFNRATSLGLDLRIGGKGYVKYPHTTDIRCCLELINKSSVKMNEWLEELFS